MFTIAKSFTFDAAHQLRSLPDGHKCSRVHGHTYRVTLVLVADALDQTGFVIDYGELTDFKTWLNIVFDHRFLNDQMPVEPTAENLAHHIYHEWTTRTVDVARATWSYFLHTVVVQETPNTMAAYSESTPIVWTA